jgi:hypothetical protein
MLYLRNVIASILMITVGMSPCWSATGEAFGTVVTAERARIGSGPISVGATVFGGDRLFTDEAGSVQVRAGAARLLLSSASVAMLAKDDASPAASLTRGTAIFSTASSKAFALHVGSMTIRPETDQPTVAQVSVVGPKQLMVRSTRGSVTVAVDDDVRVIPEGMSYRIVLDPSPSELAAVDRETADADMDASPAQGPQGVGAGKRKAPRRAGRNRFIWFAIGIAGVATFFSVYEALQSPSKPR